MDGEVRDSPRIEFSVLFRRKIATSRQISLLINKVAFMVWDDSGEAGSAGLEGFGPQPHENGEDAGNAGCWLGACPN